MSSFPACCARRSNHNCMTRPEADRMARVEIISYCDACFHGTRFDSASPPSEVACSKCGDRRAVTMTESISAKNVVDRCVLCGCGHLYIEKDFNGYIGF